MSAPVFSSDPGMEAELRETATRLAQALHGRWSHDAGGWRVERALEVLRLAVIGDVPEIIRPLGRQLTTELIERGRASEAVSIAGLALRAVDDIGIRLMRARGLHVLGRVAAARTDYEAVEPAFSAAGTAGDGPRLDPQTEALGPVLWQNFAVLCGHSGEVERADRLLTQVLTYAESHENPQQLAAATLQRAILHLQSGQFESADRLARDAFRVARANGLRRTESSSLHQLGMSFMNRGKHSRAARYFERSLRIARSARDRSGEAVTLGALAWTLRERGDETRGDLTNAESMLRRALELQEAAGERRPSGHNRYALALLLHARGQVEEAAGELDRAAAIAREVGDAGAFASIAHARAVWRIQAGDLGGAVESTFAAARGFAVAGVWAKVFDELLLLGHLDGRRPGLWHAQALWLGLWSGRPIKELLPSIRQVFQVAPGGSDLERSLAAYVAFVASASADGEPNPKPDPKHASDGEALAEIVPQLVWAARVNAGVPDAEHDAFVQREFIEGGRAHVLLLGERLQQAVPEGMWVFDREAVAARFGAGAGDRPNANSP